MGDLGNMNWTIRRDIILHQAFARWYIHDYLPRAPRAIYLDHDTIITADVGPLYRVRMRHALAATSMKRTLTWYLQYPCVHQLQPQGSSQVPDVPVFNSGVLVLDLEKWRLQNITAGLERWGSMCEGVEHDQMPLNMELLGAYDRLDWRWNVVGMGCNFLKAQCQHYGVPRRCVKEGWILHFHGDWKPWQRSTLPHPHSDAFELYSPPRQCSVL